MVLYSFYLISNCHLFYPNSSDSRIHVFDRRAFQHVATLTGHAAVVHDLAISKTIAGAFHVALLTIVNLILS